MPQQRYYKVRIAIFNDVWKTVQAEKNVAWTLPSDAFNRRLNQYALKRLKAVIAATSSPSTPKHITAVREVTASRSRSEFDFHNWTRITWHFKASWPINHFVSLQAFLQYRIVSGQHQPYSILEKKLKVAIFDRQFISRSALLNCIIRSVSQDMNAVANNICSCSSVDAIRVSTATAGTFNSKARGKEAATRPRRWQRRLARPFPCVNCLVSALRRHFVPYSVWDS